MPTPREIVNKLLEDYSGFLNGNGQPHGEPDDQGNRGEPGGNGDGQPDGPPEPEPERTITIGEIFQALPPGVDDTLVEIMNTENDIISMAKWLKAALQPHAAALEKIGIVADYAAYMLVAVAQKMRGL